MGAHKNVYDDETGEEESDGYSDTTDTSCDCEEDDDKLVERTKMEHHANYLIKWVEAVEEARRERQRQLAAWKSDPAEPLVPPQLLALSFDDSANGLFESSSDEDEDEWLLDESPQERTNIIDHTETPSIAHQSTPTTTAAVFDDLSSCGTPATSVAAVDRRRLLALEAENERLRAVVRQCGKAVVKIQSHADLKVVQLQFATTHLRQQLADEFATNSRMVILNQSLRNQLRVAATTVIQNRLVDPHQHEALKVLHYRELRLERHLNGLITSRNLAIKESTALQKLLLGTCPACRARLPLQRKLAQVRDDTQREVPLAVEVAHNPEQQQQQQQSESSRVTTTEDSWRPTYQQVARRVLAKLPPPPPPPSPAPLAKAPTVLLPQSSSKAENQGGLVGSNTANPLDGPQKTPPVVDFTPASSTSQCDVGRNASPVRRSAYGDRAANSLSSPSLSSSLVLRPPGSDRQRQRRRAQQRQSRSKHPRIPSIWSARQTATTTRADSSTAESSSSGGSGSSNNDNKSQKHHIINSPPSRNSGMRKFWSKAPPPPEVSATSCAADHRQEMPRWRRPASLFGGRGGAGAVSHSK